MIYKLKESRVYLACNAHLCRSYKLMQKKNGSWFVSHDRDIKDKLRSMLIRNKIKVNQEVLI